MPHTNHASTNVVTFDDRPAPPSDKLNLARRELAASRSRFRAVISANPDPVVLVDENGVVVFANPAAGQLLCQRAGGIVGTPFGLPASGEPNDVEVIDEHGKARVHEMRAVPTRWDGRNVTLCAFRDVTASRTHALALARALDERDEIVAVTAHELRTPLTSILGYAATLSAHDDKLDPVNRRKCVDAIERQSGALLALIEDLLTLARLDAGGEPVRTEAVDVADLVATNAPDWPADVTTSITPDTVAKADPLHIGRILTNLVSNAVKYGAEPIFAGGRCRPGQRQNQRDRQRVGRGRGVRRPAVRPVHAGQGPCQRAR